MTPRRLLAALLCLPLLTACGVMVPARHPGGSARTTPTVLQARTVRMADLLLALAEAAGDPYPRAGWAGGWERCESFIGHAVELQLSGSFPGGVSGRGHMAAMLAVVRASGWRVSQVELTTDHLYFDVVGHDVSGTMKVWDYGMELLAETGCIDVSGKDAERLVAERTLDRGGAEFKSVATGLAAQENRTP